MKRCPASVLVVLLFLGVSSACEHQILDLGLEPSFSQGGDGGAENRPPTSQETSVLNGFSQFLHSYEECNPLVNLLEDLLGDGRVWTDTSQVQGVVATDAF